MGRSFHEAASPEWPWSAEGFADTLNEIIVSGFVAMTDGGFIAGVLAPMPFSPDWLIAHEILWWSQDQSGPQLQRAFRAWAKDQQANEIRWSCRSSNERVQRFYSRFATPCEAVYSENL